MPLHLPWSMPQPQPGFTCADRIQRVRAPSCAIGLLHVQTSYREARLAPDVVVVLPRPERVGGGVDADAGAVAAEAAAVAKQRVICAQTTNVLDDARF